MEIELNWESSKRNPQNGSKVRSYKTASLPEEGQRKIAKVKAYSTSAVVKKYEEVRNPSLDY